MTAKLIAVAATAALALLAALVTAPGTWALEQTSRQRTASLQETFSTSPGHGRATDEVLSRGSQGSKVQKVQQQLTWLGYYIKTPELNDYKFGYTTKVAVRKFQNKYFLHTSGELNKRGQTTLANISGRVGKLPRKCGAERKVICVDMEAKLLRFIRNGKVVKTVDVRFGKPGYETPAGSYRVWYRDADATSGINGPDQPRVPMPWALFFNGDIAVHYSPSFAASGYYRGGGSHGCVNVSSQADSKWIFTRTPNGTLVHLY